MIYFDNAATTKIRKEVLEAMMPYLTEEYGNPSGAYKIARRAHEGLDQARIQIANAIGASQPKEIFFTGCGTESDNWAIQGIAFANMEKGKHIITTNVEHHAVLDTCRYLEERHGFSVTYLPVDKYGMVSAEDVKKAIRKDTILITIMFANNEVGSINPIQEIGAVAREHHIPFHTDAVQACGHVPINVEEMNIDLLSMSGHKFHAPKGVGVLYIKGGILPDKFMHGGGQERGKRAGTENLASIVGIGEALTLAVKELPTETTHLTGLRDHMISRILTEIPHTKLNGHPEKRLPGNVSISFEYIESEAILFSLDLEGIACSSGSACTAGSVESSHVLLAMGIPNEVAKGTLRFTFSRYNTLAEVDQTVDELKAIIKRLREISPLHE